MTNYRTYPTYKAATQSIIGQTATYRKGYTYKADTKQFNSILVDMLNVHPSHTFDSLTKLTYTIKAENFDHIVNCYGHGEPILIIANNKNLAFTNKNTNYGFYIVSDINYETKTLTLSYSHH